MPHIKPRLSPSWRSSSTGVVPSRVLNTRRLFARHDYRSIQCCKTTACAEQSRVRRHHPAVVDRRTFSARCSLRAARYCYSTSSPQTTLSLVQPPPSLRTLAATSGLSATSSNSLPPRETLNLCPQWHYIGLQTLESATTEERSHRRACSPPTATSAAAASFHHHHRRHRRHCCRQRGHLRHHRQCHLSAVSPPPPSPPPSPPPPSHFCRHRTVRATTAHNTAPSPPRLFSTASTTSAAPPPPSPDPPAVPVRLREESATTIVRHRRLRCRHPPRMTNYHRRHYPPPPIAVWTAAIPTAGHPHRPLHRRPLPRPPFPSPPPPCLTTLAVRTWRRQGALASTEDEDLARQQLKATSRYRAITLFGVWPVELGAPRWQAFGLALITGDVHGSIAQIGLV